MTHNQQTKQAFSDQATDAFRTAMERGGWTDEAFAAAVGVSATMVMKWRTGDRPVPAYALFALADEGRRLAAGALVTAGPERDKHGDNFRLHAKLAKETADVVTRHAMALADGHMTAAEASKLRPEIWEAAGVLRLLGADCETALRERVIGLRKAEPMTSEAQTA